MADDRPAPGPRTSEVAEGDPAQADASPGHDAGPASGLASDAGALDWLAWLLGPDEGTPAGGADRQAGPTWLALPTGGRPRVLVPLGHARAAAAVLDRDTGLPGRARKVAATAFRTGLRPPGIGSKLGTGPGGLTDHLADLLGEDEVALGLTIGPPRPNRKAVAQVVRGDGTTIAWAKVSSSTLSRRLVANEAAWLDRARALGPVGIEVPVVLARSTWKGCDIVVTAHLPDRRPSGVFVPSAELLVAIAGLDPGGDHRVATSPWWDTMLARVASVPGDDERDALHRALASIAARRAGDVWPFGAWHGDLTRWNARPCDATTQVWDWERADGGRPVGFDAAHAAFQDAQVTTGTEVAGSARHAAGPVAAAMADLGSDPAGADDLVTAYLVERWLRWVEDARLGATTIGTGRHDAILRVVVDRAASTDGAGSGHR